MIRIAIVENDAASLDELVSRLHQSGGAALSPSDVAILNAWLASREPGLLMLRPSREHARVQALPAEPPISGRNHSKEQTCWLLDSAQLELTAPDGKVIPLTHSEYCILRVAANTHGKLVSRKTLIGALGQNHLHYDERCLEALISRLRRKLVSCTQDNFLLRGVRGQGYLFGVKLIEVGI